MDVMGNIHRIVDFSRARFFPHKNTTDYEKELWSELEVNLPYQEARTIKMDSSGIYTCL